MGGSEVSRAGRGSVYVHVLCAILRVLLGRAPEVRPVEHEEKIWYKISSLYGHCGNARTVKRALELLEKQGVVEMREYQNMRLVRLKEEVSEDMRTVLDALCPYFR